MLARRYLAGHGPATSDDLAAYAGITVTDARRALDMAAAETRQIDDRLYAVADNGDASPLPPPRLLGMFDPKGHQHPAAAMLRNSRAGLATASRVSIRSASGVSPDARG